MGKFQYGLTTLGYMAGLTLALVCVAASGHIVRGVSERSPATNQGPRHIQNLASIKCGFLYSESSCFLVLDRRGRPGRDGWECLWGIWEQWRWYIGSMFL